MSCGGFVVLGAPCAARAAGGGADPFGAEGGALNAGALTPNLPTKVRNSLGASACATVPQRVRRTRWSLSGRRHSVMKRAAAVIGAAVGSAPPAIVTWAALKVSLTNVCVA